MKKTIPPLALCLLFASCKTEVKRNDRADYYISGEVKSYIEKGYRITGTDSTTGEWIKSEYKYRQVSFDSYGTLISSSEHTDGRIETEQKMVNDKVETLIYYYPEGGNPSVERMITQYHPNGRITLDSYAENGLKIASGREFKMVEGNVTARSHKLKYAESDTLTTNLMLYYGKDGKIFESKVQQNGKTYEHHRFVYTKLDERGNWIENNVYDRLDPQRSTPIKVCTRTIEYY